MTSVLETPAEVRHRRTQIVGDVGNEGLSNERGEIVRQQWFSEIQERLHKSDLGQRIVDFVCKHHPGVATGLEEEMMSGSFNCSFKVRFEDGSAALLRVPIPAMCAFADAKTMTEVATMLYVAERTTIPVPRVYHHGPASENPTGLRTAFIIMEYIPHYTHISDALHHPAGLLPWITDKQHHFYRQMADIILQLSELKSPVVGRLGLEDDEFVVCGGPITLAMNEMVVLKSTPEDCFPPLHEIYSTTPDWFAGVADMQMSRLLFEDDKDEDSREIMHAKFVARYLFRKKMARQTRDPGEMFCLWCDDLRPSSVLVDEHGNVVGVVDWEFSYFAPPSYVSDCPDWLLTDGYPGDTEESEGFHEFMDKVPQRTEVFLGALKIEEERLERARRQQRGEEHTDFSVEDATEQAETLDLQKGDSIPTPIHDRMRMKSELYNGSDPINLAVKFPFMFDRCFWDDIDVETFGENKTCDYHGRLNLLPPHIKALMENFVLLKGQKGNKGPKIRLREFLAKLEEPNNA